MQSKDTSMAEAKDVAVLTCHRFYYVDERTTEGKPMYDDISGPGHADFFASLVEKRSEVPWHATFVSGQGYKKFERPE